MGKIPREERWYQNTYIKDEETQIPAFFHITELAVNDSMEMNETNC